LLVIIICKTPLASWNAGLPGAVFRLPAGAWASGVGGAASADPDYMISWYNPSQLPQLRDRRASFGAGMRSLGRAESWASYDFRVPPRVGMGLSFVYRGDPFINNMYDGYYSGGDVVEERALNGAAWSAASLKIGAGYIASRRLSVGGSVAVAYQSLPTTPTPYNSAIEHTSATSIGAIDIAATYKMTPALTLCASVKNLLSRNSWRIASYDGDFPPIIEETVPPILVFASSHKLTLLERELVWSADAAVYLFDGEGAFIGSPELVIAAGARWKFTDGITLRAGIADIEISGGYGYWDSFSPRLALGFSYSLPKLRKGAAFNYAVTTDRIWAGVDQQLDLTVSF
jgi:hypothetical protein